MISLWREVTDDWEIAYLSIIIVVALTLAGGVAVYLIMQHQSEAILDKELAASAQDHGSELASLIQTNITSARALANRAYNTRISTNINALARNTKIAGQHMLDAIQSADPGMSLSGIALYGPDDRLIAKQGKNDLLPTITIPLRGFDNADLMYANGTYLRVVVNITRSNQHVGRAVITSSMPNVDAMIKHAARRGTTAEVALCGPLGSDMTCFQTTLTSHVFPRLSRRRNGRPLPMSYALDGKTGVISARDYRGHQVEAAYSPVGHFGLGLVVKIDTEELYATVRRQLFYVAPYLIALMVAGILMIRWRVLPLVQRLVTSERSARESNEKLADNEARTRAVVENIDDGLLIFQESGAIESANSSAKKIFGYNDAEVVGLSIFELLCCEDDQRNDITNVARAPNDFPRTSYVIELDGIRKDGSRVPISLRVTYMIRDGSPTLIGLISDITDKKANESKIAYLANHDALTDLPNRNLLGDRLVQAIRYARRHDKRAAVLFVDLDNFKTINDSLGHQTGDQLLKQISKIIVEHVREGDTVARQGGDEFIVLLTDVGHTEHIAQIAQKILDGISAPLWVDGREFQCSASIGISIFPDDGQTAEALLQNSDAAMYHGKHIGRGAYQFFTSEMNTLVGERLELESGLRRALMDDQLVLFYQPILDIKTNRIVSVEALIRWPTSDGNWIPPDKFIPIAEDSGLIIPISEWVINTACNQLKQWQAAGLDGFQMAVNISLRHLMRKDSVETIGNSFRETGISPSSIVLEITESVIMENPIHTLVVLHELHDMGFSLAIDDFGTGYSNLSYLKHFPIKKLKIDKSFIRDVCGAPGDAGIVTAVIAMASTLNIQVVAEGVETKEQLQFLTQQQCDEYQGYLYSRPLPADGLRSTLMGNRSEHIPDSPSQNK